MLSTESVVDFVIVLHNYVQYSRGNGVLYSLIMQHILCVLVFALGLSLWWCVELYDGYYTLFCAASYK